MQSRCPKNTGIDNKIIPQKDRHPTLKIEKRQHLLYDLKSNQDEYKQTPPFIPLMNLSSMEAKGVEIPEKIPVMLIKSCYI